MLYKTLHINILISILAENSKNTSKYQKNQGKKFRNKRGQKNQGKNFRNKGGRVTTPVLKKKMMRIFVFLGPMCVPKIVVLYYRILSVWDVVAEYTYMHCGHQALHHRGPQPLNSHVAICCLIRKYYISWYDTNHPSAERHLTNASSLGAHSVMLVGLHRNIHISGCLYTTQLGISHNDFIPFTFHFPHSLSHYAACLL